MEKTQTEDSFFGESGKSDPMKSLGDDLKHRKQNVSNPVSYKSRTLVDTHSSAGTYFSWTEDEDSSSC